MLARCIAFCSLFYLGSVFAHEFSAGLDAAEWHLEPSPQQCRLSQPIPQYGMAVFEINSGKQIHFYLESDRPAVVKDTAQLVITSPYWRPGVEDTTIATFNTSPGKRPVMLNRADTDRMIDELMAGMMPAIVLKGWGDDHDIKVGISSVNFQEAYNGLTSCLASLYPANFEQLKSSHLLFGANKYGIQGKARERLDLIVGYIMIDPSISKIEIYGHASREGRRGHNWEISRLRAKEVKDYLVKNGVDPSIISSTYLGETRPRFKGNTASDRAKNRRVYIRLRKTS